MKLHYNAFPKLNKYSTFIGGMSEKIWAHDDFKSFVGDKDGLSAERELEVARQRISAEKDGSRALYALDIGRMFLAYAFYELVSHGRSSSPVESRFPAEYKHWYEVIQAAQQDVRAQYYNAQQAVGGNVKKELSQQMREVQDNLGEQLSQISLARALFPTILQKVMTLGQSKQIYTDTKKAYQRRRAVAEKQYEYYKKAFDTLVEYNLKLVPHFLHVFSNHPLFEDILSAGQDGLMHAATTYDPEGTEGHPRFNTHAYWWIRQAALREMSSTLHTIHRPVYFQEVINRIEKAKQILANKYFREPTIEEIADELSTGVDILTRVLRLKKGVMSFDEPSGEDNTSWAEIVPDKRKPAEDYSLMRKAMQKLPSLQQRILDERLSDENTLDVCGKAHGLSRERIRQRQVEALGALIDICRSDTEIRATYGAPLDTPLNLGKTKGTIPTFHETKPRFTFPCLIELISECDIHTFINQHIYPSEP